MKINYLLILVILGTSGMLYAQDAPDENLYSMSLEELMNVPINSASKKDETLFDAPLSSYTITRSDIDKVGSTTIMEALRLAPGVIVREQTNGVYDIHIRGFDNATRYATQAYSKSNLSTLVMIDNRPVFNNNLGGTFWETLPIDINDVERIEIVRGPSAPLFGPNAVTGVINIITRRASVKGPYANATVQYGTPNTLIANGAFGKNVNEKFNFIVSGNYQDRQRFDDTYYLIPAQQFVSAVNLFGGDQQQADRRFPNPDQALNKWGANGFITYKPIEKVSFDLSIGAQASQTQKIFLGIEGRSFFTANNSDTKYANLSADVYGFKLRTSFVDGYDNINVGSYPRSYNYSNTDVNLEYPITLGKNKNNTITPGASYLTVAYSDEDYSTNNTGFLNTKRTINTIAGFIRTDLNPLKHWRIMAAIRADKFSIPDKTRFAYELATTYKITDDHLVHAAITQSNSGSFIGNTYLDVNENLAPGLSVQRDGNQNLNLLTIRLYEIGYRAQISKAFQIDLDIFQQQAKNLSLIVVDQNLFAPSPPYPAGIALHSKFENIPTRLTQNGATLSLNYVPSSKIQFKPFITIQKTETENLPTDFVSPSVNPALTYISNEHKNTPSWYGGFFFNVKPSSKFNVNLSSYTFASHNQYDASDKTGESEVGKTDSKFLLNAKVNYNITKQISVFVNGRNILNNDSREFFGADKIGGIYLAGASFNFN